MAGEINKLAADSKITAESSVVTNHSIQGSVGSIVAEKDKLLELVGRVNLRIKNLAEATERIAASADVINDVAAQVKAAMETLIEDRK